MTIGRSIVRMAAIMPLCFMAWGCAYSADQHAVFTGQTAAGRHFDVFWVRTGIGKSWDVPGRGLLKDELAALWYAKGPEGHDEVTGRATLVKKQAGPRYVGQFVVRTSADRIWLVKRDDDRVFAAADFGAREAYPKGSVLPDWATPDGGSVVQNEMDANADKGEEPVGRAALNEAERSDAQ